MKMPSVLPSLLPSVLGPDLPRKAWKALYWTATLQLPRRLRERRQARAYARREDFLEILPKHSVGAELGVFKGEFSRHILTVVRPRELHLIDLWWVGFGEFYPDWGDYTGHGTLRTRAAYEQARRTVARFARDGEVHFHVEDGVRCLGRFPDGHFDWIYIDSSHSYDGTAAELEVARLKVKPDGLIAGHDWQEDPGHEHHGVYRAIRDFTARHPWEVAHVDRSYPAQWCLKRRAG